MEAQLIEITDAESKSAITRTVLSSLPEWFGIPESTELYMKQSRTLPFVAAMEGDAAVGFLALMETSPNALEIHVMGVLPSHHRKGIGRILFGWAYQYAHAHHYDFLHVKTLDASANCAEYDRTRAYYLAMGFKPLVCLPTLWDERNPCLLLVKAVI